jgi:hypothetical protein
MSKRIVSREEFDQVVEALWSEIEFQNNLPIRTDDEAKDVAGFLTLGRAYLRKTEDIWTNNPGELQEDGSVQVPEALNGLRKLAAIFVRGMIYNGIRKRD